MASFLFALEVIFPVFFVILMGMVLKRRGVVGEDFLSKASSLVFYYALPTKLFMDLYKADLRKGLNLTYSLTLVLLTLGTFGLAWGLARLTIERDKRSAFIHTAFRSNFVYVGYPIIGALLGKTALPAVASVNLFIITLYNFLAIWILSYYGKGGSSLVGVCLRTIKNPLIIGTLLGILANGLGLNLPLALEDGLALFASLATPLALLLIGIQLGAHRERIPLGALGAGAFCVLVRPLIGLPILHLLNFSYEEFVVALVLFTTPCAANSYVMTQKMGGDGDFAAKAIVASFAINLITYPLILTFLQNIGWISPL